MNMTKKEAAAIVGGLSKPSKMPGKAMGIPAKECKVGSKLRNVKGSTCEDCYALKNMYAFKSTQDAQYRRLHALADPRWVDAMVALMKNEKHFRWHDSGDIQDIMHLEMIVNVCEASPETAHWLPTRENAIVKKYLRMTGGFPSNLNVRVSDPMVAHGTTADSGHAVIPGTTSSGVRTDGQHNCPASTQDNACLDCRMCWDRDVKHVDYRKH
jgi:hypothetical protein